MVEFTVTWMSERGQMCTDTGRATMEEINEWNAEIRRCIEEGDNVFMITIPTDGDGDWSGSQLRAVLVKEVVPTISRPSVW